MTLDLSGKVAVVTGGASGIGAALAQACVDRGMSVVIADLEGDALDQSAEKLAAGGAKVLAVPVDVRDEQAVQALRDATFERFDTAHLVFNNAGVIAGLARSWEIPASEWRWTIDVNLMGVVHGINAFMPRLIEQGEGYVVNTSSSAGLGAGFGVAAYAATKHAVVALSEALANDLAQIGSDVGVSVLCPDAVRTRIHESGRLRPQDTVAPDGAHTDALTLGLGAVTEIGREPADVARQVFDAMDERRFYVMTNPEQTGAAVRMRLEAILAGGAVAGRPG